eukprot:1140357-Pelagomonas_calceolata.AAC.9
MDISIRLRNREYGHTSKGVHMGYGRSKYGLVCAGRWLHQEDAGPRKAGDFIKRTLNQEKSLRCVCVCVCAVRTRAQQGCLWCTIVCGLDCTLSVSVTCSLPLGAHLYPIHLICRLPVAQATFFISIGFLIRFYLCILVCARGKRHTCLGRVCSPATAPEGGTGSRHTCMCPLPYGPLGATQRAAAAPA